MMGAMSEWMPWLLFNGFVLAMLAVDLGIFHRQAHVVGFKESITWTLVWVGLAFVFNAGIYVWKGPEPAIEFLTGYLIEKSLSVDNVFVFLLIFGQFHVPDLYQHRVLFWGILGALVMRAAMIFLGATLIAKFHWIIYIFGGFLVLTGLKMLLVQEASKDLSQHPVLRLLQKAIPMTHDYHGQSFFVRLKGVLHATPLFAVLCLIEFSDLIFAVDSIPAIFAITKDPFIVYTSNVFAILGLRSLYFAFAGLANKFRYLKVGLSFILMFVGVKMLLVDVFKIPAFVSLMVIFVILVIAAGASLARSSSPRDQVPQ